MSVNQVATTPQRSGEIITQIRASKTLKVAMRSDAAPFGFIDNSENLWTGYCDDFADALGEHLEEKLDIDGEIEVVKIPSTLENRFQLVRDNTVHSDSDRCYIFLIKF